MKPTLVCLTECLHTIAVHMDNALEDQEVECTCGQVVKIVKVMQPDWQWEITCDYHPKYWQTSGQAARLAYGMAQRHRIRYPKTCKNTMRVKKVFKNEDDDE